MLAFVASPCGALLEVLLADDCGGRGRVNLFILCGDCDAGWRHRERHFPRTRFHGRHHLNLLFDCVLLEVFVELSLEILVLWLATMVWHLRQRGFSTCGLVSLGDFMAVARRSSLSCWVAVAVALATLSAGGRQLVVCSAWGSSTSGIELAVVMHEN